MLKRLLPATAALMALSLLAACGNEADNDEAVDPATSSSTESPERSMTRRVAGTGPIPITRGSTPATALATMRAMGSSPSCFSAGSETIISAQAPSLMRHDMRVVVGQDPVDSPLSAGGCRAAEGVKGA